MAVKKLSSNIQSVFTSSVHIFSYKRAIEELVYNALDAQSTSIAIRIDIQEQKVQVVDNGNGISKDDFDLLGQKFATSKFDDMTKYKSVPSSYGFRGQSLASLVEVSKRVKITSRINSSEETWTKTFHKGKGSCTQTTTRPSKGTTVEVNGFLYNLNIQNKGINSVIEINAIKTLLEQLSLVHNNVSFSLRDDSKNEISFKAHKNFDTYQALKYLFDIEKSAIQELQIEKNEYKLVAYVAKDNDHPDQHHWIFLNKKFVNSTKMHKLIHDKMSKALNPSRRMTKLKKSKGGIIADDETSKCHVSFYFIFITCPYCDYDISNTPQQSTLEFKDWHEITKLVEKLVKFYAGELKVKEVKKTDAHDGKNILLDKNKVTDTRQQVSDIMKKILGSNPKKVGVSQMQNGIKGKLIKRKRNKSTKPKLTLLKVLPTKDPKIKKRTESYGAKFDQHNYNLPETNIRFSTVIPPKNPKFKKRTVTKDTRADHINQNEQAANLIITDDDKILHKTSNITKIKNNAKKTLGQTKIHQKCKPKTSSKKEVKKKKLMKDHLVEIFKKPSKSVVERCNLLAQEFETFITRNRNRKQSVNETVNYDTTRITTDNKNIQMRRVEEMITYDYYPLRQKIPEANQNYVGNVKKDSYKTSYDLLKPLVDTETTYSQNHLPYYQFDNIQEGNPNRFEKAIPQLSYQSHHYNSNKTLSHHYERDQNIKEFNCNKERQFIFTPPADSLSFDDHPIKFNPAKHKYENIYYKQNHSPKKIPMFEKGKRKDGWSNYLKHFNVRSFSDSVSSHTIEYTHSKKDNREIFRVSSEYPAENFTRTNEISNESVQAGYNLANGKDVNRKIFRNDYLAKDFNLTYEIPNTNAQPESGNAVLTTKAVGFTYTMTTSSLVSVHNSPQSNHEKFNTGCTTRYTHSKPKDNQMSSQKTELNIIFISNSNEEVNRNIDEIEPLNICETIMSSSHEQQTTRYIDDINNKLNDSLFNLALKEISSDVRDFNIGDTQQHLPPSPHETIPLEVATVRSDAVIKDTNENVTESNMKQVDKIVNSTKIDDANDPQDIWNDTEKAEDKDGNRALIANEFYIQNRPRFLPKGMSPIFENRCENRCSKTKPDSHIVESGYFADDLYDKFRDKVQTYSEVYEAHVKNPTDFASNNIVKVNNRLEKDNSSLTFNANSLAEAKVLGQIDNKFIATIVKGQSDQSEFLVLFDQHAVHERIRLEENLADYFNKNEWRMIKLDDDVILKLPKEEILFLHNYKGKFNQFGLEWTVLNNHSISLHGIPAAILGKNPRQAERVIRAVRSLISEAITMIRSQKGCVSLYPKSVMELVFSEACRYAIKFGDSLPHTECVALIKALPTCKTPFQCAHGRPVMAVIMDIKPETRNYKINMEKFKQYRASKK